MEIGLTSVTFRKLDYETILDYCVKSGLSCIEWGSDVHVPEQDVSKVQQVKEASDRADIRICSYGSYYRLCEHENYQDVFVQYLKAAVLLKAPIIRLWAGKLGVDEASKEYYEQAVREAQGLCDMAAKHGITLAFEFHRGTLSDTAEHAIKLYKDIDRKNLGLYFQYDSQISIEENISALEKMLPYVTMVHVAYHVIGYGQMSLEEGEGVRLWTRLVRILKKNHVKCELLFEFLKDSTLEGLMREADIMRHIVCGEFPICRSVEEKDMGGLIC